MSAAFQAIGKSMAGQLASEIDVSMVATEPFALHSYTAEVLCSNGIAGAAWR